MLVVAGLLLAMMNSLAVQAQKQAEVSTSEISKLLVSKVSESTDGNCNFRSFEVEAPEDRQDTPIIVLPPLRFLSMMIMLDQYVRIMAIGNPLELMGMKLLSIIKERIL